MLKIGQKLAVWAKKLPHQHTLKFPCLPIMMPPKREIMSLEMVAGTDASGREPMLGRLNWSSTMGETESTKHWPMLKITDQSN